METIYDLLREIRFAANQPNCVDRKEALALAERIEKATKLIEVQVEAKHIVKDGVQLDEFNRVIAELNEVRELNRKCCDENERLKAALQPVLECDRFSCDCGAEYAVKCSSAVNDAQRIWKEGE